MTDQLIQHTYDANCLHITLNRPEKRNALTPEMIAQLTRLIRDAPNHTRYVTLRGAGPCFCSGVDIKHMRDMAQASPEDNRADASSLATLLRTLYECPHPIIIACQGAATGGAIGLLACADIVVSNKECFFQLSEVTLGITPATIAPFVVHKTGVSWFLYQTISARAFTVKDAKEVCLIHEWSEDIEATFDAIKKQLDSNSPTAMRLIKEQTRELNAISAEDQKHGISWLYRARHSEDALEGLTAFLEKRKPVWKG